MITAFDIYFLAARLAMMPLKGFFPLKRNHVAKYTTAKLNKMNAMKDA